MAESKPSSDSKSSSQGDGIQKSSHPFVELQGHGIADLLDVKDLKTHLPEAKYKDLVAMTKRLRAQNPGEMRLSSHVGSFVISFDVSIEDLLAFSCKRSTIDPACTESTPCIVRPFSTTTQFETISDVTPPGFLDPLRSGLEYKRYVMPAVATAKLVRNEFEGVLKDELKMGCNLTESYLELVRSVNSADQMAENYRMGLVRGDLTFAVSSKVTDVTSLFPRLPDGELNRMCTTAFLTRETVERGVVKHQVSDDKTCYYFPEEHGLAHYLKIAGPSVISGLRVYTLALPHDSTKLKEGQKNPKSFVRLPEKAYTALLERLFVDELHPKLDRKFCFRDLTFWLGYKIKNEEWSDPTEEARLRSLPYEELTKKRRISFKISMAVLTLASPPENDLFWSSGEVIGSYLPGIPFVDGCTPKKSEDKKDDKEEKVDQNANKKEVARAYKDIKARELPYYLSQNYATRKEFKTSPANRTSYEQAILDV